MNCQCETVEQQARKKLLHYTSAAVLGMNDALVEMVGALAGFTIALADNRLITLAGITTGVAATLSMASAEFLSEEVDARKTNAYCAASFTGFAYLLTVGILLLPYFVLASPWHALGCACIFALFLIGVFTFAVARIRNVSFGRYFRKMVLISFFVALVSFLISCGAHFL